MSDTRKIREDCFDASSYVNSIASTVRLLSFPSASVVVGRSARVAILVGEGVDEASVKTIYGELLAYGALPCLVSFTSGKFVANNISLNKNIFSDLRRPILFEATVIPEGDFFVNSVEQNAFILNFVRQQYHRCKPILAIGNASQLLEKSDVFPALPSGLSDPSIIIGASAQLKKAVAELNVMLPK